MDGQIAGDRQRAVVVVEHRDLVDVHAIRLQLDPAGDVRVADAGRHDRERAVLDSHVAVGCGSAAEPVTRTCASSVPVTLVSAVVKPWTSPRSIGLLSMVRSIGPREPTTS